MKQSLETKWNDDEKVLMLWLHYFQFTFTRLLACYTTHFSEWVFDNIINKKRDNSLKLPSCVDFL